MPLIHTSPSHIPTFATGITGHLAVWHALRGQDRFFGALQGQWRPTRKPRCQVLHVALGKDRERWAWQDGSGEKEEAESFGEMKDPVSFHSSVTFHGAMVAFWVIEPPTQKNHGCPNFHAIREAQHQDHAAIPGFFP